MTTNQLLLSYSYYIAGQNTPATDKVTPTGRWKVVTVNREHVFLYLEVTREMVTYRGFFFPRAVVTYKTSWESEADLTIMQTEEIINECSK